MTKSELLEILREGLGDLPEKEVEKLISYYEEAIADRMEEGKSEEAAVADLGTPGDLLRSAREFITRNGGDAEEKEEMREFCAAGAVNSLLVEDWNTAVELLPSADGVLRAEYAEGEHDRYQITERDGEVVFRRVGDQGGITRFIRFIADVLTQSREPLRVWIPRGFAGKISITTKNGRISVADITSASLTCQSSNGRAVLLRTKIAGAVRVTAINGGITVNDCEFGAAANLRTANSRILLERVSALSIEGTTSNGRVEASNVRAVGAISLSTSNGKIQVSDIAPGASCTLTTSNGRISGTLSGVESQYRIRSSTSNGRNNLRDSDEGTIPLTVRTSNGSIDLGFTGK